MPNGCPGASLAERPGATDRWAPPPAGPCDRPIRKRSGGQRRVPFAGNIEQIELVLGASGDPT